MKKTAKTCRRCRKPKALRSFGPDKRTRDGRRSVCRSCEALDKAERTAQQAENAPRETKIAVPRYRKGADSDWYREVSRRLATELLKDPCNVALRLSAGTIANLMKGAKSHIDIAELDRRIADVERAEDERKRERGKGKGYRGAAEILAEQQEAAESAN